MRFRGSVLVHKPSFDIRMGFKDPWDLKRLGDNWSLLSNNRVLEAVCLDKLVSEHLKTEATR